MNFKLLIADINPKKINFSGKKIESVENQEFIYDHLRHYCSKFFPIPSITVNIQKNSIIAVTKTVYLQIALDLNLPTIRAVIEDSSNKAEIDFLEEKKDITLLDYNKLRESEKFIDYSWHVFFFENELSSDEESTFRQMVYQHFEFQEYLSETERANTINFFVYSKSNQRIEFSGLTPFENHLWANQFRKKLLDFNSDVVKIISYQGRSFF